MTSAERKRTWYLKNRTLTLERAKKRQSERREERHHYMKEWRSTRLEEQRERSRQWKAKNRERHRESSRRYHQEHAKEISAKRKVARRMLKQRILDHYGTTCACCGETQFEFLTLDHINGDGAVHRRRLNANGRSERIYRELIALNFPEGYRTLCFNCNSALGFYGFCPHSVTHSATALAAPVTAPRPPAVSPPA